MHRIRNRPRLVGDGARDGLTNPPGRVCRELVPGGIGTCRPPSSIRCCLPESDRGTGGRGSCISSRSRPRGGGSPRRAPSSPARPDTRPGGSCRAFSSAPPDPAPSPSVSALSLTRRSLICRSEFLRSSSRSFCFLFFGLSRRLNPSISRWTRCTESTASFIASISRRLTGSGELIFRM